MAIEGGALFNQQFIGQGFNWWIGQVADDSYWRDNINPGKFDNKQGIKGWGYRYKVRIFGLHDWGEDSIKSEDLPWANIMYGVTDGAFLQNSGSTPKIRQGNIVYGFFLDGSEQEQPVIMGVMGNNSQTPLKTKQDGDVTNTQPGTVAISGYADPKIPYEGTTAPPVADADRTVSQPKTQEQEKEFAETPGIPNDVFGIPTNRTPTDSELADISSAKSEIELILRVNPNFSQTAQNSLIKKRVESGKSARKAEANSPRAPRQPGATVESESPHLQTAATVKLDEIYCKKRVILKPTNIVDSCNRAMKTDMDNMTTSVEKAMNALSSYTDAVSITKGVKDLQKVISDSSKTQSKYMKVIMDNVMEYSQKKMNKEMTKAVAALPSTKRSNFLDLKDEMTQNILSNYNEMTGGMSGMMEGILSNMLNLNDKEDKDGNIVPGIITQALNSAFSEKRSVDNLDQKKLKAMPKVPICVSEDAIAAVVHSNMPKIEQTNNNILDGIDTFIDDMSKELASSRASSGITGILSKLGNIKGNMSSALEFKNVKQNVFPFELPPNEAVSDYYTFCSGGESQAQTQVPSVSAISDAITNKIDRTIPSPLPIIPFAEPPKNAEDVFYDKEPFIDGHDWTEESEISSGDIEFY